MSHKVSSISKSVMQEQQACAMCGQPGYTRPVPTYAAALTGQKTSMSSQEARQDLHEQQLAVAINPNANPLSPATKTKSQELNCAYGGMPYSQAPKAFSPNDPMQGENKKSCSTGLDLNTRTPAFSQQMTGGIHAASATVRRETGDSLQGSQEMKHLNETQSQLAQGTATADQARNHNKVMKKKPANGGSGQSSSQDPLLYQQEGTECDSSQSREATIQNGPMHDSMYQDDYSYTDSDSNAEQKPNPSLSQSKGLEDKCVQQLQYVEGTICSCQSECTCDKTPMMVSTESPQQNKWMERVTNVLFSSPTKDWKRMYEQEKKDRNKERKKYEEEKKRDEKEKNNIQQVLQQYQYENAQYERNQKLFEQEVERMRILHHEEKKKSDVLRKMILETREGGFSTTEPPYDDIATKYESLFGATANAVVKAYGPENATKEDKKAHKKKWMHRLCGFFNETYKRNKASLLDKAFSEIFTPKLQAMQPGYDPDLTKTEVDEYGHLLQVFLKKYPNGHPDKKVSQIVTKYQDKTRSPHERDGSVELEKFVREALQVCWAMLTVNPPMLLDTSEIYLNEDTQHVQMYGVVKGMEDAAENYSTECTVEFYRPVLYKNFLRDVPIRKGWTGIDNVNTYI